MWKLMKRMENRREIGKRSGKDGGVMNVVHECGLLTQTGKERRVCKRKDCGAKMMKGM